MAAEEGPMATILKNPVQFREFLFHDFVVSAFPQFLADNGGDVVNSNSHASHEFGAMEEGNGED